MIRPMNVRGHTFLPIELGSDFCVIDAGANEGEFGIELIEKWGCQVHFVEPAPVLARNLRKRELRVTEAALNTSGNAEYFLQDATNSEASHVTRDVSSDRAIKVPGIVLYQILPDETPVDLLKMDIEGAEIDVLLDLQSRHLAKIKRMTIEFHDFLLIGGVDGSDVARVKARLKRHGFYWLNMSFRTHGDVLCINSKYLKLTAIQICQLKFFGQLLPGLQRTLRRLAGLVREL